MGAASSWLPTVLFGPVGGAVAKNLTQKPVMPTLPDFSTLLAQAPTAKDTSKQEEALARRRNRKALSPAVPSPTMLTGPLGTTGAAPTQRKTLLGV